MNWKSTAVVSGATLLAGWLASAPPVPTAPSASHAVSQSPQTAAAASDIEQQAERLQTRTRQAAAEYGAPARNLFQFGRKEEGVKPAAAAPHVSAPMPVESVPARPSSPSVALSGIASDPDGQRTVRTAILSSPAGVLLVREGDEVLGQYRVAAIGEDSVQLTSLSDGATLRLVLR